MPDFSKMRTVAGAAKKPAALPAGDYQGLIKSFEFGDQNRNKTPYVRFHVGLQTVPAGAELPEGTDLAKRQMRRDYYLTDDALWRLDELLRSLGVAFDGQKTYEELVPSVVGAPVLVEVQQYLNESNGDIGNQIGKLVAAS